MRRRFVVRGVIVVLALIVVGIIAFPQYAIAGLRWVLVAPPATPPPPTITAPRGELPGGVVGLTETVLVRGSDSWALAGSGFLLRLNDNKIIGVTTAHSLFDSYPDGTLMRVGLGPNGGGVPIVQSDTYLGKPGVPLSSDDVSVDYVLLNVPDADPRFALDPDPRGAPQPGERVTLYSGLGDGQGGAFGWQGTVFSANNNSVFILMDPSDVDPAGMSGSPVVSQYTGKLVGMAMGVITASRKRWLVGIHPVAHLLQLAGEAKDLLKIVEYRR